MFSLYFWQVCSQNALKRRTKSGRLRLYHFIGTSKSLYTHASPCCDIFNAARLKKYSPYCRCFVSYLALPFANEITVVLVIGPITNGFR